MKGNSGKAQAYLDQATAYLDSSFGDRVEAQYLRTKSFYYWKEKDYRHALSAVNLALKINRDLDGDEESDIAIVRSIARGDRYL